MRFRVRTLQHTPARCLQSILHLFRDFMGSQNSWHCHLHLALFILSLTNGCLSLLQEKVTHVFPGKLLHSHKENRCKDAAQTGGNARFQAGSAFETSSLSCALMVHLILTSFTPVSAASLDYSNDSYLEGNPKQTTPQNKQFAHPPPQRRNC